MCPFFFKKPTVQHQYSGSVSQEYGMQQQGVVYKSLKIHRNELHHSPVRKHVTLLQQAGQFALRTSCTV